MPRFIGNRCGSNTVIDDASEMNHRFQPRQRPNDAAISWIRTVFRRSIRHIRQPQAFWKIVPAGCPVDVDALAFGSDATDWGLPAAVALVMATGLAALRSFYSSHFRALSLALPFYCAGLPIHAR